MASIRKLPSGKWNAQVRRHGYSPVSKSFLVEKDAIRWARNVESELDRGLLVDISEAKATTLANALKRYLAEVTPHKKGHKQERQRLTTTGNWLSNQQWPQQLKPNSLLETRADSRSGRCRCKTGSLC